jgi:tetratricopeptide (TPR) repeat protein
MAYDFLRCIMTVFANLFFLIVSCSISTLVFADEISCGALKNHFGPFDYYTARSADVEIVETRHFTREVEQLKAGKSGYIAGDLSYTLGVFPNHPRALNSIANLALREKRSTPEHSIFSVDCWFDRAIRFRPDDANVRMIYAVYLNKIKRQKDALEQLEMAIEANSDNPNLNYNIGLVYFDLKDYDKSLEFARRAYDGGYPLLGLKNKLKKAGVWPDGDVK